MPTLWFIVPAHGRAQLARVCLRQLRRTCDKLADFGIQAAAVVIANDENLETAKELGFGTVRRNNKQLGRKFNDGIQLACDPAYNPRPADYVMPFGSDDWIDYRVVRDILRLPLTQKTVVAFRHLVLVRPDGREMTSRLLDNKGGIGLRLYPAEVMKAKGYRPADEDKNKGCDTSTLVNLTRATDLRLYYHEIDPRQIVDWKSSRNQVTPYHVTTWRAQTKWDDPFTALRGFHPDEALEEMRSRY